MNIPLILEYAPEIAWGFVKTVWLAVLVILFSSILAFSTALFREYRVPVARQLSLIFVNTFRAIPALLTVYLCYYGLPQLGLALQPDAAAVLGITLVNGAYLSEDVRGGLAALNRGQYDACKSLGLPPLRMIRRIVLPQAIPVLLPAYMTTAIQAVKGTSIASLIGVNELTKITVGAVSITFDAVDFMLIAAVLYLFLTGLLAIFQAFAERHMARRFEHIVAASSPAAT